MSLVAHVYHKDKKGGIDMSENMANTIPTENTAICEHCGMKVKADAQFCSSCGKSVIAKPTKIFCQTCGTELEDDEMFCSKCGSSTSQNKNAEALNNIAAYNASLDAAITQKPKKKKVWKVLLILLGVLTALAIVGCLFRFLPYTFSNLPIVQIAFFPSLAAIGSPPGACCHCVARTTFRTFGIFPLV